MANRVSQTPNHGGNRGEIVDVKNVIQYFGSFKLGKDGNLEPRAAAAAPTPREAVADASNSKKIKNQCHVVEEAYDKILRMPQNSLLDNNGGLWGHNFFVTQGREFTQNHEQESLRGMGFQDCYGDPYKPESFAVENSSKQPKIGSLCSGYAYPSSASNYVFHAKNNPTFLEDSSFYDDEDYEFSEVTNNADGRPSFDLSLLQEIIDGGDSVEIGMLVLTLRGSYYDLMTQKSLCVVFQRLVNACRGDQLDLIVADVLSCSQSFIRAAFCKRGATSIIKLIKRLKKSAHALTMAQILSTQFFAIMTHDIARFVIQHCFIYFPNHHNKILYEKAILYCQELARNRVGCRSLNELINTIGGEQRSRLLNHIADCSLNLSNHQYGNYVVQNVLSLKNEGISARIVLGLRGELVELAEQPAGSHVVEKCMEASNFGIVSVVKEIVETPKASLQLSKDQFGNYVIQTALKKTKERGLSDLYESLVESLLPHYKELIQSASGKNVVGLIKDEAAAAAAAALKWRSSSSASSSSSSSSTNRKETAVWRLAAASKEREV